MKKLLIIPILLILLSGCGSNGPSYLFLVHPRECKYIFVTAGYRYSVYIKNETIHYDYYSLGGNWSGNLSVDSFALALNSYDFNIDSIQKAGGSNVNIDTIITAPLKDLEGELIHSYVKYSSQFDNGNSSGCLAPVNIEYRTTGITKLNIMALDTTLFGKTAGTSLNDFFEIGKYVPAFIASYESESLVYGYYDENMPTSIDKWLNLEPYIQPEMFFSFKTVPSELPVTTRFVIQVELNNEKQLSDTTAQITITK